MCALHQIDQGSVIKASRVLDLHIDQETRRRGSSANKIAPVSIETSSEIKNVLRFRLEMFVRANIKGILGYLGEVAGDDVEAWRYSSLL